VPAYTRWRDWQTENEIERSRHIGSNLRHVAGIAALTLIYAKLVTSSLLGGASRQGHTPSDLEEFISARGAIQDPRLEDFRWALRKSNRWESAALAKAPIEYGFEGSQE